MKRKVGERKRDKAHKLPSLAKWREQFWKMPGGDSTRRRLLKTLRDCALSLRSEQRQPFYGSREIAEAFGVSLSTVAQVFGVLQREGTLRIVRGSRTEIEGRTMDRGIRTRALIALPISLPRFLAFDGYRTFFVKMRHELRHRGFTGVMAFYDGEEATQPDFVKRLLESKADCAMWLLPEANVHETILSLNDNGVGAISIGGEFYSSVPQHYRLNRSKAARHALTEWQQEKIKSVAAVYYGSRALSLPTDKVETLLRESTQERGYRGRGTEALIKYLEELSNLNDTGIAFVSPDFAQFVCYRAPEHLFALMRKKRVMLPHGPLTVQFGETPDVPVDLIAFDWQELAEKIATDLNDETLPEPNKPHIFYAKWLPRISLQRCA